MIFGPRVWRITVALTAAPSTRGVPIVTLSPSPSITTSSRITCAPSSAEIRSTRIVSSFDTRYCLPPVLTNAYMASILVPPAPFAGLPFTASPLTACRRLSRVPAVITRQLSLPGWKTKTYRSGTPKRIAVEYTPRCAAVKTAIAPSCPLPRPRPCKDFRRISTGLSGHSPAPVQPPPKGPCRFGSCGASPISRCSLSPVQGCAATTASSSSIPSPGAVGGMI